MAESLIGTTPPMNGTNGHPSSGRLPLKIFEVLQSRAGLAQRLGRLFDGRRDSHTLLGYKQVLQYQDFKARYLRQHIAHRLCRIYPEATWAYPPTINEDNQNDTDTPFEAAWNELADRLHIFSVLERTDILANLGQYATILIGLRGQSDLSVEATPVQSPDDVLYLTPYSEEFSQIIQLENRPDQPTFGRPLFYTFHYGRGNTMAHLQVPVARGKVHASRVIHIAEDCLDDDVYGISRLEPIFDLLDDIYKVQGGSAEMFWQDAKRRLVFALRDDFRISKEDEQALVQEVEEFVHELKSFVRVQGMDVNTLNGLIASPKEHFEVIMELISATTGIPKRIFMGSERGELASTQDSDHWLERISRRQVQFAEGRILRPLIDRLITLRALPTPTQPYTLLWDNLLALSEQQQATLAKDVATALNQYAPGMADMVVPPGEYRERYLGLKPVPDPQPLLIDPLMGAL